MIITKLVELHLDAYQVANNLDPLTSFTHLRRQIRENQDLQDRRNFDGHVTSSFAVLDMDAKRALMIHHLGLGKWLFPGGHYEGMVAPRISALREVREETGFPGPDVRFLDYNDFVALDIDTHEIPARPAKDEPAHWHHDFLFLGQATKMSDLIPQEEEIIEVRWVDLDEAGQLPDERVRRAVAKIKARLA